MLFGRRGTLDHAFRLVDDRCSPRQTDARFCNASWTYCLGFTYLTPRNSLICRAADRGNHVTELPVELSQPAAFEPWPAWISASVCRREPSARSGLGQQAGSAADRSRHYALNLVLREVRYSPRAECSSSASFSVTSFSATEFGPCIRMRTNRISPRNPPETPIRIFRRASLKNDR